MSKEKPKKPSELKPKIVPGRIMILKAIPYKGSMVYIRLVDKEIFEYLVVFGGQIYSSYLIITPKLGKKILTKREIAQSAALIFVGATTTVDALINEAETRAKEQEKKRFS